MPNLVIPNGVRNLLLKRASSFVLGMTIAGRFSTTGRLRDDCPEAYQHIAWISYLLRPFTLSISPGTLCGAFAGEANT